MKPRVIVRWSESLGRWMFFSLLAGEAEVARSVIGRPGEVSVHGAVAFTLSRQRRHDLRTGARR